MVYRQGRRNGEYDVLSIVHDTKASSHGHADHNITVAMAEAFLSQEIVRNRDGFGLLLNSVLIRSMIWA